MTDSEKQNDSKEVPSQVAETVPTGAETAEPNAPEAAQPAEPEQVEAEVAKARQEAAAANDRYMRAMADLENFRRRTVREKEELRAFAAARVVEELLPVLDNLSLGLTAAKAPNAELSTLVGGIEMVATQLKSALGNHGLKEVNPTGQAFDPNLHEAIAQQPSSEIAEGNVLQVVRIGYTLNGRLLRPASVIVSSGVPVTT